jgi:uncharacterized membrane protein (UPF0182 family)
LPLTIDSLEKPRGRRRGRKLLILLALIVGFLIAAQAALSSWVDLLWFRSLGYVDVFWTTLRLEWVAFLVFAVVTFLIMAAAFSALKRAYQGYLPSDHKIILGGQPVSLPVDLVLRILSLGVSLVFAVGAGITMASDWPVLALFWYAQPVPGNITDPIFGKPLNFFLFTLPAAQLVLGWLLTLSIVICFAALLFALIAGGSRAFDKRRISYGPSPWRGLSFAASPLLLLLALNVYLSRFQSLLEHHTIFDGINYTDAHVMLTGLLIVCAALVFGAVIARHQRGARPRANADRLPSFRPCSATWCSAHWWAGTSATSSSSRTSWIAKTPYIANNIKFTRQAYGLDQFTQREFPAETTVDAADPANNQPRCRTSACGTGTRCRTRCARSRRSAPTTTFPTSTSIATASTAPCAR